MNSRQDFEKNKAWGISTAIDLKNCDPNLVRSEAGIRKFVYELCELLDVKRFGECIIVHFGESEEIAGFSMTQLIETSLVSGHFVNSTNSIFLDVFSCKYYDPEIAVEKAKTFFKAESATMNVIIRK